MRKSDLLYQLQQVDTALDRARERLGTVESELRDRSEVENLESEHKLAQPTLQHRVGEQRDLELEVEDLRQKLGALEKKLYGGTVANPKELDAMTKDAQQFRNLISTREDRLIELYDVVEAATSAEAEISARLDTARTALVERHAELQAEHAELTATLAKREAERQELAAEADAQALRSYESLRRTRGGLAVAVVAQRTCQGCRITLPANEEIRARASQDLVFCQSCGRVLYSGL